MTKRVYLFEEGDKSMRDLLGGKGANLAEMTNIGLPVPPRLPLLRITPLLRLSIVPHSSQQAQGFFYACPVPPSQVPARFRR